MMERLTRMAVSSMAALGRVVDILARLDPGLWYLLDLRRRSAVSWIPAALLLAAFAFGAVQCLLASNIAGGTVLSAVALVLLAVKMRAVAHARA
jgi:hypothetical protein